MGAYGLNVGKITSIHNSLQPRDMVAHETSIQRVIAICQPSNSLTLRGKPMSTAENRNTQNLLKLCETVVVRVTKHGIKYFARAVSCLTARVQNDSPITWAPRGERSEKSQPIRFSLNSSKH